MECHPEHVKKKETLYKSDTQLTQGFCFRLTILREDLFIIGLWSFEDSVQGTCISYNSTPVTSSKLYLTIDRNTCTVYIALRI